MGENDQQASGEEGGSPEQPGVPGPGPMPAKQHDGPADEASGDAGAGESGQDDPATSNELGNRQQQPEAPKVTSGQSRSAPRNSQDMCEVWPD